MAHTKAGGTTYTGRDSQPKYLGVKKYDGEVVKTGDIIVRQRGTHFYPGKNVKRGGDDTLFALGGGTIKFRTKMKLHFDGTKKRVRFVDVVPSK